MQSVKYSVLTFPCIEREPNQVLTSQTSIGQLFTFEFITQNNDLFNTKNRHNRIRLYCEEPSPTIFATISTTSTLMPIVLNIARFLYQYHLFSLLGLPIPSRTNSIEIQATTSVQSFESPWPLINPSVILHFAVKGKENNQSHLKSKTTSHLP